MNDSRQKPLLVLLSASLVSVAAFWAASSHVSAGERAMLPNAPGVTTVCDDAGIDEEAPHEGDLEGFGAFQEVGGGKRTQIVVRLGAPYRTEKGLKTVPFEILSIGTSGFADGLGATSFSLDASRPVTSAIWEKEPGTEFPAIQEMRFHFLYTVEAMPGKVFRSVNPAVMRSDNVLAFPPPRGTTYQLAGPVELEDLSKPGAPAGRILRNRATVR
jgi:hypothetical protein